MFLMPSQGSDRFGSRSPGGLGSDGFMSGLGDPAFLPGLEMCALLPQLSSASVSRAQLASL